MLREATDQLSSQFNHTQEPFTKDSGEHADMGGRSNGDNNYNSNLPSDEPELKLEDPDLSSLPELEIMTPSRTPHAEEQEADAIVAGEEEKHPCKPSRATNQSSDWVQEFKHPWRPETQKHGLGSRPVSTLGDSKKRAAKGKLKFSPSIQWRIGVKWVSVHWGKVTQTQTTDR